MIRRIANGLNNLNGSPKLTNLNLSGNKIKDLDELKALSEFNNLAVLDLFNNEVGSTEQYREKIFSLIPSLVYLDGYDAHDNECVSEGEDEDELNGNDSDEDGNEGEIVWLLRYSCKHTIWIYRWTWAFNSKEK